MLTRRLAYVLSSHCLQDFLCSASSCGAWTIPRLPFSSCPRLVSLHHCGTPVSLQACVTCEAHTQGSLALPPLAGHGKKVMRLASHVLSPCQPLKASSS